MKINLKSDNSEETEQIAEKLASKLKGGEVIELISDLGGGKTTLTRGLARGIGSDDRVASPTFTISKIYKGKNLELHHFDFYRLHDAGLMEHEIHDVIGDSSAVVVVEWGDVAAHVLPEERLTIRLKSTGDESRELELKFPQSLSYLAEDIK
ncbi:MAG: tRNA (adenosine(37)-N6)-threonylcarbamoyltransferase complex ATPase subunit type 1 TsaE [Acidobacteriota bacterium]